MVRSDVHGSVLFGGIIMGTMPILKVCFVTLEIGLLEILTESEGVLCDFVEIDGAKGHAYETLTRARKCS